MMPERALLSIRLDRLDSGWSLRAAPPARVWSVRRHALTTFAMENSIPELLPLWALPHYYSLI